METKDGKEIKVNSQITASKILSKCLEIYDGDMINEIAGIVSEYAEAYYQQKLKESKQYHPMGTEPINEICLTCGLHCPDNCPLDK